MTKEDNAQEAVAALDTNCRYTSRGNKDSVLGMCRSNGLVAPHP